MKTETGFVAVTPDGEYLCWAERTTHTGYHLNFWTTPDIDLACFSSVANNRQWPLSQQCGVPRHTWVPVTRRIEITLDGYGVPG